MQENLLEALSSGPAACLHSPSVPSPLALWCSWALVDSPFPFPRFAPKQTGLRRRMGKQKRQKALREISHLLQRSKREATEAGEQNPVRSSRWLVSWKFAGSRNLFPLNLRNVWNTRQALFPQIMVRGLIRKYWVSHVSKPEWELHIWPVRFLRWLRVARTCISVPVRENERSVWPFSFLWN